MDGDKSDTLSNLTLFFKRAHPLLRAAARTTSPEPSFDCDRLAEFAARLRGPLADCSARACMNPWLAAGLGHDEVRVSAVLARLWDRNHYGDEAYRFLCRFLAEAGARYIDHADLDAEYRVQTEHCLNGSSADRVDITVETNSSIIGIEVKIHAGEGQNQLERYSAALRARGQLTRRKSRGVVFLAPYGPSAAPRDVAHVTWRKVSELAAGADASTKSGWLIAQFGEYCRSLAH